MPVRDALQRPLRDLRISVTDRCNFRCTYCMPREVFGTGFPYLAKTEILTFEEITRLAESFVKLGVEKIRLTGGEPLLRKDLEKLVGMLARLDGIKDLALTTNGAFLSAKAQALRDAGLKRLTVSLDALEDHVFAAMNDTDFPVARVLEGIEAAVAAGFSPVKINMVVKRGVNDHCVAGMARHFGRPPFVLRFIEYMDVGTLNGWRSSDVVPAREIIDRLSAEMPLRALRANYHGEVAKRFEGPNGGEIGVITSVTQPFCGQCTRARISAAGTLYTCLFASQGTDLRELLRNGVASNAKLLAALAKVWSRREDRYSEMRNTEGFTSQRRIEMSHIGG